MGRRRWRDEVTDKLEARILMLDEADERSIHIFDLHDQGYSCKQIDSLLNLFPGTAHQKVVGFWEADMREFLRRKARGERTHEPSRSRRFTDAEREEICALYQEGVRMCELQKQFNTSTTGIRHVLQKAGLR